MLDESKLIKTRQQLKEFIEVEKKRYSESGLVAKVKSIIGLGENGVLLKHQIILRKTEYLINNHRRILSWIYRFRLSKMQNKYAIHIPVNCCDKGLRIMHVGPVLINGNANVGENCTFHINTALVAAGREDKAPTLENDVVVGIGSVVLGDTHVSSGVVIGANAVVNKSVLEENIAVAGVPAKKVSNNGSSTWGRG